MLRPSLVLLHPTTRTLAAAQRLDCPLVLVGPDPRVALSLASGYDEFFQIDLQDQEQLDSLCRQVLRGRRLSTVTALSENGQLPAARARDLLGMPGLSPRVAALLGDELAVSERLAGRPGLDAAPLGLADGTVLTVASLAHGSTRRHLVVVRGATAPAGEITPVEGSARRSVEQAVSSALDELGVDAGGTVTEVAVAGSRVVVKGVRPGTGGERVASAVSTAAGVDWEATVLSAAEGTLKVFESRGGC